MVEVFKTNVTNTTQANWILDQMRKTFINYKANFDLEDCDNILRVESVTGSIEIASLISFLKGFGYIAEVLPDEVPVAEMKMADKPLPRVYNFFSGCQNFGCKNYFTKTA